MGVEEDKDKDTDTDMETEVPSLGISFYQAAAYIADPLYRIDFVAEVDHWF